jgi:hypothetical protein
MNTLCTEYRAQLSQIKRRRIRREIEKEKQLGDSRSDLSQVVPARPTWPLSSQAKRGDWTRLLNIHTLCVLVGGPNHENPPMTTKDS